MSVSVASLSRRVTPAGADERPALEAAFAAARAATLERIADLDDADLCAQPDPGFSPIGWHFGHIGYTEALWLVPGADPRPEWQRLLRQDGLAKAERRRLPSKPALLDYLARVRDLTLARLDADRLDPPERLWRFVVQHETMHAETIAFLRRLAGFDRALPAGLRPTRDDGAMIDVPAGLSRQGNERLDALDNERSSHAIELRAFRLSSEPVSQGRYRRFIEAGGYRDATLWSEAGWRWRIAHDIERPLHWIEGADELPVHGVSAYEAEAYCRSIGARLPSEAEWERAANLPGAALSGAALLGASLLGPTLLGQVWQWTASTFEPYAGFEPYPYTGYSAAYFDGRHRVLKGGSWATGPACLRPSFRNWYEPSTRQIFAGFRYAQDV
jgi:ergothioneine biosynthesis protein EgtB